MLRAGVLVAVIWLSLAGVSHACRTTLNHTGIIYESAPSAANLPADYLVLEVAFDMNSARTDARGLRLMTARVNRVLHGEFSGDRIEVLVGLTSCSHRSCSALKAT
jgi:hypothetical protein